MKLLQTSRKSSNRQCPKGKHWIFFFGDQKGVLLVGFKEQEQEQQQQQ